MRRANAYLNLGQAYNAKSDLERAQQLAPDNESIKS
jgi:cytochrome c-type biogenesis protein CcmH/NrfG